LIKVLITVKLSLKLYTRAHIKWCEEKMRLSCSEYKEFSNLIGLASLDHLEKLLLSIFTVISDYFPNKNYTNKFL